VLNRFDNGLQFLPRTKDRKEKDIKRIQNHEMKKKAVKPFSPKHKAASRYEFSSLF
jgi:hypothetical protein